MYYVRHGSVPRQRHTQHRAPDGSLYAEELFGVEGFTGRSSLLYHLVPPTQTEGIEPVREIKLEAADEKVHRHHLTKTGAVAPKGDALSTAIALANEIAAFPQACLRNDRASALAQWDLTETEAIESEVRFGLETLRSGETISGAQRFAQGEGRHGEFS